MSVTAEIATSVHKGRAGDVFQTIVKGRKSWKTMRGNGEAVWAPELEAALLEGLENYEPGDSRETRLLGRFPMRNRFLSDYIFNATGKRRTPKQVGSRLQQLRDTCGGKRLLKLLSHCPPDDDDSDSLPGRDGRRGVDSAGNRFDPILCISPLSSNLSTSSGSPVTPTESDPFISRPTFPGQITVPRDISSPAHTVVRIDILPETESTFWPSNCRDSSDSLPPFSSISGRNLLVGYALKDEPEPYRPSSHPRPLRLIDPTVTFVASCPISASSLFSVCWKGNTIHTELVPLSVVDSAPPDLQGSLLYSTTLIPGYWQTICDSADPTHYSIFHEIIPTAHLTSLDTETLLHANRIFSAVYIFRYPPDMLHGTLSCSPPQSIPENDFLDTNTPPAALSQFSTGDFGSPLMHELLLCGQLDVAHDFFTLKAPSIGDTER